MPRVLAQIKINGVILGTLPEALSKIRVRASTKTISPKQDLKVPRYLTLRTNRLQYAMHIFASTLRLLHWPTCSRCNAHAWLARTQTSRKYSTGHVLSYPKVTATTAKIQTGLNSFNTVTYSLTVQSSHRCGG